MYTSYIYIYVCIVAISFLFIFLFICLLLIKRTYRKKSYVMIKYLKMLQTKVL